MTFQEKLSILIERRGWKPPVLRARLRDEAGLVVGRNTPYRWVNGERVPDLDALRALSLVLDISADVLIRDDIDLPPERSTTAEAERSVNRIVRQLGAEEAERRLIGSSPRPNGDGVQPAKDVELPTGSRFPGKKNA